MILFTSSVVIISFVASKNPLTSTFGTAFIEKYYGEGVFFEDALNLLYSDAIDDAAKEANLKIVNDEMKFDLVSISKQDGVDFKVTFTTYPEMEVGTYKGLKAEKLISEVTEQEVQEELNRMADRNSRMVEVKDRAAAKGDSVVIDFEGFTDGKAFEGGKGESYTLELGSGQFIPGFEDQILGHNAEEEFEVNVTFPEEYGEKSLAGKPATFKVKLHEIKVKELPAQDDEFAKDVSEFDTLEALKEDLKKKALERKEKAANDDVENQLLDQLIEGLKGDIPEAMFKNREEQSLKDFEYRLQMQGISLEDYLKYTNTEISALRDQYRADAALRVKSQLVLEAISKAEKIEATPEEISDKVAEYAKQFGNMTVEDFEKNLQADDRQYFADQVVVEKTLALLVEAYDEEVVDAEKNDVRTVMRFHPAIAPFKCAVLPLSKKLSEKAREIQAELSKDWMVDFDDTGSIGKRYRREDEIGTPYCITVDFDTVGDADKAGDNCVTVRDRDTMEQVRLPIDQLKSYLAEKLAY